MSNLKTNDYLYSFNKEFYSVDRVENDYNLNDRRLVNIHFYLDTKIDYYERRSLTLFEAIGTIGGIFEIFNIYIGILVGIYSQSSFKKSILRSLRHSKSKLLNKRKSSDEPKKEENKEDDIEESKRDKNNERSNWYRIAMLDQREEEDKERN